MAYRGVGRLFRGFTMMGLASLEAIGNLAWTLAFWTLAIAMLLCAAFVWFPPVEAMIIGLGRRWLQTFLASWGASLVFGLFMALLFRVAETGNAVAVLGMGIVVSVVALAFTLMALWMFAGALLSIFTVATGGVLIARPCALSEGRFRDC